MTTTTEPTTLNGINTDLLRGGIEAVSHDPAHGMTGWQALANAIPLKSRLVVM